MAGIHAQYHTNVHSVLNTPKIIPYLNQGTQKQGRPGFLGIRYIAA